MLGGDPWRDAVALHRRLAYVPGDVTLWPSITGGEVIDLLGRMRGGLDRRRRDELLERFDLDPRKKARTYSKGNRQKVALIAALASDAELLLLDEPTSGLDPLMESVFQQCIQEVKRQGRTVLLSSHILAEIEALCDRVSIIRLGRTVESGTLADLRHLTRTSIAVETTQPLTGLEALPGVHDVVVEDHHARFDVDTAQLDTVVRRLAPLGVRSLTSTPPTLEELFLRHYGDEQADRREGGVMTGTLGLLRFMLRRERAGLPWWLLGATLLVLVQSTQSQNLYDTPEKLERLRQTIGGNTAVIAMSGPTRLLELDRRRGRVRDLRVRGDRGRADEHVPGRPAHPGRGGDRAGRADPLGPGRAGRRRSWRRSAWPVWPTSPSGCWSSPWRPAPGCRSAARRCSAPRSPPSGIVFAALTAVAAQVFENARAVYGAVALVLGAAYVLRAAGDVGNGALSWASPIGWGQRTFPYAGDRWWPLLLPLGVLGAAGDGRGGPAAPPRLRRRPGAAPARPGRRRAGRCGNAYALAWRLQRGALVGWAVGLGHARRRVRVDRQQHRAVRPGQPGDRRVPARRRRRHRRRVPGADRRHVGAARGRVRRDQRPADPRRGDLRPGRAGPGHRDQPADLAGRPPQRGPGRQRRCCCSPSASARGSRTG